MLELLVNSKSDMNSYFVRYLGMGTWAQCRGDWLYQYFASETVHCADVLSVALVVDLRALRSSGRFLKLEVCSLLHLLWKTRCSIMGSFEWINILLASRLLENSLPPNWRVFYLLNIYTPSFSLATVTRCSIWWKQTKHDMESVIKTSIISTSHSISSIKQSGSSRQS